MTAFEILAGLAERQYGAFNRRQAHDAGLSDKQLAARVRQGLLVQPGRNVFRYAGTPRSARADLMELLLDVDAPAWATGHTAGALWGFDRFELERPFHLVVPSARCVIRSGAEIHRTDDTAWIDFTVRYGIPVTAAERTVFDLARRFPARYLLSAVDSGIRDRVLDERRLHQRIATLRSQGKYGIPALCDVLEERESARGGESFLEREYLELIADAGLPRPTTQKVIGEVDGRAIRVDCYFPGTNVVVELLGYAWHRTVTQMNRDTERMNTLLATGMRPYQFTYDQVLRTPASVVAATRAALRAAA
jgi:very-short-patch-repair endonuclease